LCKSFTSDIGSGCGACVRTVDSHSQVLSPSSPRHAYARLTPWESSVTLPPMPPVLCAWAREDVVWTLCEP
jgi:hypothetical protein